MQPVPKIVVIVVTWRGLAHIQACLDSLLGQTISAPVIVIDNASDDGTAGILETYRAAASGRITIHRVAHNLGFAGGVSTALELIEERFGGTDFVALLNDDAAAEPAWLSELLACLTAAPEVVAATSQLRLAVGGRINNTGGSLTSLGYGFDRDAGDDPADHQEPSDVFAFCGGAALIRLRELRAVGGFPAEFFLYYEDTDTSWRLRLRGGEIRYVPSAVVTHIHRASSGGDPRAFSFYNERNRLWMVIRCAPGSVAASLVLRYLVTLASLMLKRVTGRAPAGAQFSPALRVAILRTTIKRLPHLLGDRRSIDAGRQARRRVWLSWNNAEHSR